MSKNKKTIMVVVTSVVVVLAILVFYPRGQKPGNIDDFAKCLAQNGGVMYGASWCGHCQNEKADFGDSFRFVNYVECTEETQKCIAAGIKGYPTWVFGDGQKFEGEQGLNKLSAESGCPLNVGNK